MPEGDAVLRTARRLDAALAGERLLRAELRWPTIATADLVGRVVLGTATRGKHLLTRLDDGRTLHSHLRMDGSWRVAPAGAPARSPWVRAVLGAVRHTAIGDRLGALDLVRTSEEDALLGHLGPDVLAADFPVTGLSTATAGIRARAEPIAAVLLDQTVQAGLGTIWTAESLFTRRISPWTPARAVEDPASLLMTARELMLRSVGGDGRPELRMYGRTARPCVRCGAPVRTGRVGVAPFDRPVFWCEVCQPTG